MKLYSKNENYKLYQGNMLDMLEVIEPNTIDSIVTDPPYGLTSITKRFGKEDSAECQYGKDGSFARLSKGFMGKEWDGSGIEYNIDTWKKCYEVLKPGGYLLAFGGSRTFHRIACAIEDAGFEIRDTIMWLYGSGFPKSMNIGLAIDKKNGVESKVVGKTIAHGYSNVMIGGQYEKGNKEKYTAVKEAQNKWNGWGTALKPSFEPIIVARKPFKGSLVDNVIEYGVGGINIDECRVETIDKEDLQKNWTNRKATAGFGNNDGTIYGNGTIDENNIKQYTPSGRFPANTILTYDETDFDEVCGGFPDTKSQKTNSKLLDIRGNNYNNANKNLDIAYERGYDDSGSASRYFYCAKASKKDRDEGCQKLEDTVNACSNQAIAELKRGNDEFADKTNSTFNKVYKGKNTHPTVKPTELMQYLVRLVTPNGGVVLDPFNGSGSTGKAVMYENHERNKNYKYIGIELTEEYLPIAKARIEYAIESKITKENQEEVLDGQMSLF
jgi:site-specific DNA-methyltransferase (adenine-specific)